MMTKSLGIASDIRVCITQMHPSKSDQIVLDQTSISINQTLSSDTHPSRLTAANVNHALRKGQATTVGYHRAKPAPNGSRACRSTKNRCRLRTPARAVQCRDVIMSIIHDSFYFPGFPTDSCPRPRWGLNFTTSGWFLTSGRVGCTGWVKDAKQRINFIDKYSVLSVLLRQLRLTNLQLPLITGNCVNQCPRTCSVGCRSQIV